MAAGRHATRALDHLYQGQSNDCYWHGLFGGIYISHMRLATYEHLIAAEDLAETDAGRLHEAERLDLDLDGHDEVRLSGAGQVVTIDLAEGAGIGGWDIRPVRHACTAVMRRRPEAYHQKLRDHVESELDPGHAADASDAPTSIHEIFLVKEPGLAAMLHYDRNERRSGLVRFLAPGTTRGNVGERRGRRARRRRRGRLRDREARARPARRPARRLGVERRGWRERGGAGGQDVHAGRRSPGAAADREGRGHQPVGVERSRRSWGSSGLPRCSVAVATPRPGWRSTVRGRPMTPTGRRPTGPACRRATTPSASRSRPSLAGGRCLVCAGRDDLEFRGWLRARLPGRRHAPDLAASLAAVRRGRSAAAIEVTPTAVRRRAERGTAVARGSAEADLIRRAAGSVRSTRLSTPRLLG